MAKLPKIASAWTLMRSSLAEYRANWKPYVKILAVVAIPANLLLLTSSPIDPDPTVQAYFTFASIIMNVALIWALVQREQTSTVPAVAQAYYDGSIALVRFLIVSLLVVVMLIPAGIGAIIYRLGVTAADYNGMVGPEQFLIAFVALLLGAPSMYLIVRYSLGLFVVVRNGLRPVASLRQANRSTRGRFWPVAGRFVLLGAFLVGLAVPLMAIYFGLSLLNFGRTPEVVFNILSSLTILPIGNIYMLRLYRALEHANKE